MGETLAAARRIRFRRIGLGFALVLFCAASPTRGAEIEGVMFPERLRRDDVVFALNGVALLRYRIFIKAYVAALYLGDGVAPEEIFGDVPKRLEIEYFWEIASEDFAKSTQWGIDRNVDPDTLERLRPRIESINSLYRDVAPGDRYALTYVPGRGTELALNGEPLGLIEGADFAAAIFAIWLGEQPLDRGLKSRLLGTR